MLACANFSPQVWLQVRDIAIRYIEDNVKLSASCTKLVLDTDKNDKQVMAFFCLISHIKPSFTS